MNRRQFHIFFNYTKTWQLIQGLFTFVFLPEFICFLPKIVWCSEQFLAQNRLIQVRTGKNKKVNKQKLVMFWL